jgi:hypothetical protein
MVDQNGILIYIMMAGLKDIIMMSIIKMENKYLTILILRETKHPRPFFKMLEMIIKICLELYRVDRKKQT